jgi:hypothetical protein
MGGQEDFLIGSVRSPMTEILEKSFPYLIRHRDYDFLAALVAAKTDATLPPLDVLELKGPYLTAANAVGVEQLNDGEVPPAHRSRAIDAQKDLLGIFFRNGARNSGQLVGAQLGNRFGQIALQVPPLNAEAEEGSQGRLGPLDLAARSRTGILGSEQLDPLRRDVAQPLGNGIGAKMFEERNQASPMSLHGALGQTTLTAQEVEILVQNLLIRRRRVGDTSRQTPA